jgi:hypothetical protein
MNLPNPHELAAINADAAWSIERADKETDEAAGGVRSRLDIIEEAHKFEDDVVSHLCEKTGVDAEIFSGRTQRETARIILRSDEDGYNLARNIPDIVCSVKKDEENMYGKVFFVDAKKSQHKITLRHADDVSAINAYVRWQEFCRRPVLLAFWHLDESIGFTTVSQFLRDVDAKYKTIRKSECKEFYTSPCHCRSFEEVVSQFVEERAA